MGGTLDIKKAGEEIVEEKTHLSPLEKLIVFLLLFTAGCSTSRINDIYKEEALLGQYPQHVSRVEALDKEKRRVFAAEHNELDFTKAAARTFIEMPELFKGYATVFGETRHDSDDMGIGADFDIKTPQGILIGGTAEKTLDETLKYVYTGKEFKDFLVAAGAGQLDDLTIFNATLYQRFHTDEGGYFVSVGGKCDENEDGQVNAVVQKFTKEKGRGFGFKAGLNSDLSGNLVAKGEWAIRGNNFGNFTGSTNIVDKGGNDLSIVDNLADYRGPFVYARGKTVLVTKYVKTDSNTKAATAGAYNNFGDFGFIDGLVLGFEITYKDIVTDHLTIIRPVIGFKIGPVFFHYAADLQKGEIPNHEVYVGVNLLDLLPKKE